MTFYRINEEKVINLRAYYTRQYLKIIKTKYQKWQKKKMKKL